ncbi:Transcription initiation factor IIB [Cichlidogyrus casuarinus]|uniref:Transcription initiation factor IIB n=1 Tax=Cichlidogyrus casuarinus TaxID=1844966 RepID=A0ABD2PN68_9PLAT
MVCSQCGLVVAERVIDVSSEWRTFSNDANAKDNSRVGAAENSLLSGGDISTMISGPSYSDARQLDANGKALYKNRRNIKGSDRALLGAFREIGQMADRLNLPKSVSEIANRLFKQVYETKNLRGRSNDAVSTACLYMACRQEGVPRTFKEVCAVSRVSKKEIGKVFKRILKILETNVQSVTVEDFMSRFCANLDLNNQVKQLANNIARQALNLNLVSGRSPVSVAAAAIYLASYVLGFKKDKKGECSLSWLPKCKSVDIGEVTGCAEATITLTYREMHVRAADLIPPNIRCTVKLENLPV